jgi:hypothetical protein
LSNEPLNLTTKSRDASPTSSIGSMMGVPATPRTLTPPMPPQIIGKGTPNHLHHHRPPPFREPPINGIDCTRGVVTMNGRPPSDVTSSSSSPVAATAVASKGSHTISRNTHISKGRSAALLSIFRCEFCSSLHRRTVDITNATWVGSPIWHNTFSLFLPNFVKGNVQSPVSANSTCDFTGSYSSSYKWHAMSICTVSNTLYIRLNSFKKRGFCFVN